MVCGLQVRDTAQRGGAATKLGRVRLLSNPDFFPESIPVQTRAQEERVGSTESHPPIKNVRDARAFSQKLIECNSALRRQPCSRELSRCPNPRGHGCPRSCWSMASTHARIHPGALECEI